MTRTAARGRPAFAQTQRAEILRLLREAGPAGVSRAELIFERHITQCGARVDELKRQGFEIVSELRDGEKYVRYVLKSEPLELRPLSESADWFERTTGRERQRNEGDLPLFSGNRT
jgi:hypothetical protein